MLPEYKVCRWEALRSQPTQNPTHVAKEYDLDPRSKGSARA